MPAIFLFFIFSIFSSYSFYLFKYNMIIVFCSFNNFKHSYSSFSFSFCLCFFSFFFIIVFIGSAPGNIIFFFKSVPAAFLFNYSLSICSFNCLNISLLCSVLYTGSPIATIFYYSNFSRAKPVA